MTRLTNPILQNGFLPNQKLSLELYSSHWRKVGRGYAYPKHRHQMFEIMIVMEGCQSVSVGSQSYIQNKGDVLLICPGQDHRCSIHESEHMAYFCIHFDIDCIPVTLTLNQARQCLFVSSSTAANAMRPYLRRMAELAKCGKPVSLHELLEAQAAFLNMLSCLVQFLQKRSELAASSSIASAGGGLAQRIQEKINELAYADGMDECKDGEQGIVEISKSLHISLSHCNRVFRRAYGQSPRHYLTAVKLRRAKTLLLQDGMTIEQVSYKLGYQDRSHFSRQFKRWTGTTPSEYKQLALSPILNKNESALPDMH